MLKSFFASKIPQPGVCTSCGSCSRLLASQQHECLASAASQKAAPWHIRSSTTYIFRSKQPTHHRFALHIRNSCNCQPHNCTVSLQVLIPAPFWVSYPEMAKLAGAKPVIIDCPAGDNFLLTPAALQASLSPASRLLILCSPSNPTGSVYSRSAVPADLLLW